MKFIQKQDRRQAALFPISLEESIGSDNEVRLIDLFVSSLDLEVLGFVIERGENGRPAYHPTDLLRLFIYGYMNRCRSSRQLEKECRRNIELMWLLGGLTPDHNTISNFRRDNPDAIKKVFRITVQTAGDFNLIGGKLLAGDSTKFRAQNSKKNNYNSNKIKRHTEYIDRKLEEYRQVLKHADGDREEKQQAEKEIDKHLKRKEKYTGLSQELQESGEEQISTSDPESRQMVVRNNITEVAYNIQSTVDAQHCIPIDYEVTNNNDSKAMGSMVRRSKTIVRSHEFTALFDKGYHTGSELQIAQKLGIKTLVAIPAPASNAPDPNYNVSNFTYDPELDHYTCPQGHRLTTNGSIYTKHRGRSNQTSFKQYRTKSCKTCPVRSHCTSAKNGKLIERNVFTPVYEQNRRNIEENPGIYKRRQAIVEHPFGTIKRQWGFSYIISKKGKQRASADVGFMFIAYNLRRMLNILGHDALREYLRSLLVTASNHFATILNTVNEYYRRSIGHYISTGILKAA